MQSLARLIALAVAFPLAASAQSLNQKAVARMNQDLQTLWTRDGLPKVYDAAMAEAQKLVGVPHQIDSSTTATITNINSLQLDCPGAPGARRLDGGGAVLAMPLHGTWGITAGAEVHIKGKILFFPIDQTFSVTIGLTDLIADFSVKLDSSDLAAPRLVSVNPPRLQYNLKVRSSNFIVNALGWITSGLLDTIGKAVVAVGAHYLAHKLDGMLTNTPSVMNNGGPALAAIPRGRLEEAAARLGDQIERYRRPFGPVLEMHFDTPYDGTWADSLFDPNFTPGQPSGAASYGDSGEFTGHYLAALSLQYATTHDATAKARARSALETLRTLLTMRGEPGNMNRSIMPLSYLPPDSRPPTTYTSGQDYALMWNGELHYFADYMSRDEYMGLFYGLSFARDLLDDPELKASAQASMEMALDYLLANDWTWRRRDGTWGERWAGVFEEQYAWIAAAYSGNPAKYQTVHDQYQGFTDLIWTGTWMAVIDPYYSYYKFQLGAGAVHVLLAHETDAAAFMRAYQSVAILRHYIGHHLNAHFNNTYLAFAPAAKTRLGAENENLLSRWLQWKRRRQVVDLHGDPSIEKMDYTAALNPDALLPADQRPPATIQIAKYPLPPDQRIGSGFMWDVSPCQLDPGYPAGPDYSTEGETLDFFLPYWMARYYGALAPPGLPPPAPTPTPTPTPSPAPPAPGLPERDRREPPLDFQQPSVTRSFGTRELQR